MANGTTVRSSTEAVEKDAAALAALRDAYGKLQAIKADDNRSWIYWAGQHGYPSWYCWHHSRVGMGGVRPYDLFLPWHRAYLLYWEHAMRDQNNAASLPWWDWTSETAHSIGVPSSFATAQAGAELANPLYAGPVPPMDGDAGRQTLRYPGDPNRLPTKADVDALLTLSSFIDFQRQLEDIHDAVHGWTGGIDPNDSSRGGDMGSVATSAFDPIFWSHHCMLDRIWYLWQLTNGVNTIPSSYLSLPLAPFALKVQDVLDINHLGYEYAQSVTTVMQ